MRCLQSSTGASSAPAQASVFSVLSGFLHGLLYPAAPSSSAAVSGPASSIAQPSKPAGRNVDLTRRAVMQCNRKPEAVERYLALHRTLGKGR